MTTTDDAAATTFAGPSPQPLGALPWPAGMLVLPPADGPDAAPAAAALVAGSAPETWPPAWSFVRAALDGDAALAAGLLDGDDDVADYNRAVLVGGEGVWAALSRRTVGDLAVLVATARFSVGDTDLAPPAEAARGEVVAVARSARASAALERGDVATALTELADGADAAAAAGSPVLAATLRATRAELLRDTVGDPAAAAAEADRALADVGDGAPEELRAEILVTRAMARQQQDRPELLAAAVADYLEALRVYREDTHPELFAVCNQHLALCYLTMAMGTKADRIRVGVAVNSLRAALRVFTPDTHPVAWASAQLNLANALQYLPSAHQAENLDEAVQLYEELLAHRDPRADPVGTARILANQGNALGHLAVFADARDRLTRARALFADAGDEDAVAGVDEVLASLAAAEAEAAGAPREEA